MQITRNEKLKHGQKRKNNKTAIFTVCVNCEPCDTKCSFLNNEVKFVIDKKFNKSTYQLRFDKSLAICTTECHRECITSFNLIKTLKDEETNEVIIDL